MMPTRPITWIHGHCESPEIFRPITSRLDGKYQHTLITLPGCDLSLFPRNVSQLNEIAERIRPGIPDGSILVGHSLGGYIALCLANLYPEVWSGLVLLHSTPFADTPERKRQREHILRLLEEHGAERFYPLFVDSLFYRYHPAKDLVMDIVRRTPTHVIHAYTRMMMNRENHLATLKRAGFPCLLIAGEYDPLLPAGHLTQLVNEVPAIDTRILTDCGHMGMYECPDQVTAALASWINDRCSGINP